MKAKDICENSVICNECGSETEKIKIDKAGFKIRTWHCMKCGKEWYHPIDSNQYLKWGKLDGFGLFKEAKPFKELEEHHF